MFDRVLHQAVINDQLEVLSSVLDVTLTLDNRDEILNRKNNDQQTALQIAVLSDNAEAVIVSTWNRILTQFRGFSDVDTKCDPVSLKKC